MMESCELMRKIVRCPHLKAWWNGCDNASECAMVAGYQRDVEQYTTDFSQSQVPEPWAGKIEEAPILFVSSVCGFAWDEHYPLQEWSDDEIDSFFTNRFQENVKSGRYYRMNDLTFNCTYTRYWAAIRKRAEELLCREPEPGVDYALTEIVHCKSRGEDGVWEARDKCSQLYLADILGLSGAKVLVCMGNHVRDIFVRLFLHGLEETLAIPNCIGPLDICGRERYIVFLPHTNARRKRSFSECLPAELPRIHQFLTQ